MSPFAALTMPPEKLLTLFTKMAPLYTAGRDLAAVGDAAGEGGNRRDDDAVDGPQDRTGIADPSGERGDGGDKDAVVERADRPAVADATAEGRGVSTSMALPPVAPATMPPRLRP